MKLKLFVNRKSILKLLWMYKCTELFKRSVLGTEIVVSLQPDTYRVTLANLLIPHVVVGLQHNYNRLRLIVKPSARLVVVLLSDR